MQFRSLAHNYLIVATKLFKAMIYNNLEINVVCEFKIYNSVVCDDKKQLWQLETYTGKRTIPMRILTFNDKRNAYRINSLWISKNRLLDLRIEKHYSISINQQKQTPF